MDRNNFRKQIFENDYSPNSQIFVAKCYSITEKYRRYNKYKANSILSLKKCNKNTSRFAIVVIKLSFVLWQILLMPNKSLLQKNSKFIGAWSMLSWKYLVQSQSLDWDYLNQAAMGWCFLFFYLVWLFPWQKQNHFYVLLLQSCIFLSFQRWEIMFMVAVVMGCRWVKPTDAFGFICFL